MSSKLSDRVERLEKRCDVQLQQLSDLQSSHHRLAESVRRLEAEVYTDAEVPDAPAPKPPPVAPPSTDSLVLRLATTLGQIQADGQWIRPPARAAIREVAAWLRTKRLLHAAELLEQEANR